MEIGHFLCACCGRKRRGNPRLSTGRQRYCRARRCQAKRRARWQASRVASDPQYRADQREASRIWRQKRREYYDRYRKEHPKYARRNRQLQVPRDRRRRVHGPGASAATVHTGDRAVLGGTYLLVPLNSSADGVTSEFVVTLSQISSRPVTPADVTGTSACKDGHVDSP